MNTGPFTGVSAGDFPARRTKNTSNPSPVRTDEEEEASWIERIRGGDEEAFEELFHCHYAGLCSFAISYVGSFDSAREIVQIVLMKIWERREQWSVTTSLKGYLYQAVRNEGLNHNRQKKRRRYVSLEANVNFLNLEDHTNPEEMACFRERLRAGQQAIDQLPERQRSAFVLHRRHDLTYKQIAEIMGISPRTVEVHIAMALKSLHAATRD